MAKPVRSRTNAASALATGSPTRAASFASSTRLAPEAMTSTPRSVSVPRKTRDLAIWSTWQPRAAAASAALRVERASSRISPVKPRAASASRTFWALALSGMGGARSRRSSALHHHVIEGLRVGETLGGAQLARPVAHALLDGLEAVADLADVTGQGLELEVDGVGDVHHQVGVLPLHDVDLPHLVGLEVRQQLREGHVVAGQWIDAVEDHVEIGRASCREGV